MKEVIERCNWLVNKCNDKAITPDVKDDFRYLLEEIERLNNDIKVLLKENGNKEKVIKAQDNIIKEIRELLNQEWYSVLRKETIRKAREILDKEKE